MIKNIVSKFIEKKQLIQPDDKVLVALSGGADSVALLHILISLNYKCEAAHCNFKLREKESDRDEEFVRQLCKSLNIPLHVIHFDTIEYAAEKKISIEMAARELRYEWFANVKQECGAAVIAIAHHQDDSVETILLNLIRGTGINGLLGIRPLNGDIVRPLLGISRNEIIQYLEEEKIDYITDSTNLSDAYTRNKIRLKIIPEMQKINPSVRYSILSTADHLQDTALIYNAWVTEAKKRVLTKDGIRIENLLKEASPKTLLFDILYPLGFNSTQLDDIFQSFAGQPGKQFISSTGHRVVKDRTILLIDNTSDANANTPPFELQMEKMPYSSSFVIPRDKDTACFDADKITQPLTTRKWKHGDSFVPFGMKSRKLLSNYMTDRKFSLIAKENQWVLCSGDDIVWLIGERTDNRFRVDDDTKEVLVIHILPI
ncbi:tRNA lysidine(34) synthetase TilS [Bacteroides sp. 519]|uniref:tRNA lysidine(34) synthetase TilS n=1 Tax=Bacteroides sp. 519 TaxID=2302937 RepID=UPI0013D6F0B4|nr:tRNA lysidine(34) synthetase TilS [Bacteroides sp. 519]